MDVARHSKLAVGLLAVVMATVGCTASAPSPSMSASPSPSIAHAPGSTLAPAPTGTAGPPTEPTSALAQSTPTAELTEPPTPTPMPTPHPADPAGWTAPDAAITSAGCESVDLLVDTDGGRHLVAECDGLIRYAVSRGGSGWSGVVFGRASGVVDRHPRLALDGDLLYAAYSQAVAQGGCGGEWYSKVGVYVRSRLLPSGAWTAAMRIGSPGDRLESFAVRGGVMDLAVVTLDGASYLETAGGASFRRYPFSGDAPSVAVAPNGGVGLAYAAGASLRYATLVGSALTPGSAVRLPGDDGIVVDPQLVYDAAGRAHLGFEFASAPGCAHGDSPLYGTYYATNADGGWTDRRVTAQEGATAMAIDARTGAVAILVDGSARRDDPWGSVSLYRSLDGRSWARTELVSQTVMASDLAVDPTSGHAVVAYLEPSDATAEVIAIMAQR